ncbi:MAG TPA: D-alanyl-D-alanine carboxypeptidase family protein [Acidimicrobiia bacterium]|nr:D-alanyl-D-alanine carboxypeptidase family protein [Acidimicrobiia bacterium]
MRPSRPLAALALSIVLWASMALPAFAAPLQVPAPPREGGLASPTAPTISAPSWVIYDADAGVVLSETQADVERPMASTTKMMTALLALKYGDLDDMVRVSEKAAAVGEAEVGLLPGERFPLRLLVTALVIRSANDAAMAVAEHIGGSVDGFVEMMNDEAEALGLEHTHFENPHGLDHEDHYSTANDLLHLGLAAMSYPEYREMASTLDADFPDAPDGTERTLSSTNLMLETYPGTIGVKTGYTNEAGLVFVAGAAREGRTLFAVVMGSDGRRAHFSDAGTLLDWGFEHFRGVGVVAAGSYKPPEPVRVVDADPATPEPEREPVVITEVREADGEPLPLFEALGWVGHLVTQIASD